MKSVDSRFLDFFDRHVTDEIRKKYGYSEAAALRKFLYSQTYSLLRDPETELYLLSPKILFDLWEAEQVTGDPCNSIYIREPAI